MAKQKLVYDPDGGYAVAAGEPFALYGSTGATRRANASQAAVTGTAVTAVATTILSQVATSGKWAFSSSTAGIAMITRTRQLRTDMVAALTLLNEIRAVLIPSSGIGAMKGST